MLKTSELNKQKKINALESEKKQLMEQKAQLNSINDKSQATI